VDASQNVGIGATPVNARKLTVSSTGQSDLSVVAGSSDYGQLLFGYVGADNKGIVAYNNSDNSMQFYTNNTERARFNSTGALVLAGGTTSADGKGITFPATQSASTNANTLDDYEEGSWTPSDGSGASLSITSSGTATYTKIGRVVNACCNVTYPSTANTSNASIGGLPFTANNTGSSNMQGAIISNTSRGIAIYALVIQGDTKVAFTDVSDTNQTNANMSTKTVRFTAVYIV
jgi:hypothetical protein